MKISELRIKLDDAYENHGDIEIYIHDAGEEVQRANKVESAVVGSIMDFGTILLLTI